MKSYSGYTSKTPERLLLDAGAFFKNFNVKEDTFETAKSAGKLLGATKGGGEFSAVPAMRALEIDGIKGKAKGCEMLDSWDVYIKATFIEASKELLLSALCAASEGESENNSYDAIVGKANIGIEDYIDNITWVGTLSGSQKPVIIQVYNAINTDGLKFTTQDKNETTIPVTFYGHYADAEDDNPPFKIYYPKGVTA